MGVMDVAQAPNSIIAKLIEVKSCPQCGAIYHGDVLLEAMKQCYNCKVDLVGKKMYLRWEVERILCLVIAVLLAIISTAETIGPHGEFFPLEEGFTAWHGIGIVSILIICSYTLGNYFLKIPKFKTYLDIESAAKSENTFRFNWKRFAFEFLYMIVPIGALGIFVAMMVFWRFLFGSK